MAHDELDVKMKYFSPHRFVRSYLEIKPYQLFIEENDSYIKNINPENKRLLIQKIQASIEKIILDEEL